MEYGILFAIFILLAATVALVPLAHWAGLGGILGYLAAGILIGPFGLRLVADTETIHQVAEWGVILMLFLIGLELQPSELWRMRQRLAGLGLGQLVATAAVVAGIGLLAGFTWQTAAIIGLALAMSSTAIAMQSLEQRAMTKSETGRGALSILLVQDVAVIPVLAAIPLLAAASPDPVVAVTEGVTEVAEAIDNPAGWLVALQIVGAFVGALVASRYLIRPLMRFIAAAGATEAFTAFALLLVIGAAVLMEVLGLSPALGAFLGGVLLADSEYRHELQSNLEPFKGLLLGLFFVSVGMSISFSLLLEQPLMVVALLIALVAVKITVLYGVTALFRMDVRDRLLLAILLSQAGEFAFVIFQFARDAGSFDTDTLDLLTLVVALSMATTPLLLMLFDRVLMPRLHKSGDHPGEPGGLDGRGKVVVLGYGRFGQIVTRMLRGQGYEMTLIDDDPAQIALVKRFGVKVFYGNGSRLSLLRAAGVEDAKMVVIAVAGRERILAIAEIMKRAFPHVPIAARAVDRAHAHELMALGVEVFERETFRSAIGLGERALTALGVPEDEAHRIAQAFERHDVKLLEESYQLRNDQDAYVGFVRHSTELLEKVMIADRERVLAAPEDLVPTPPEPEEPQSGKS